jgi:hypothetical protein
MHWHRQLNMWNIEKAIEDHAPTNVEVKAAWTVWYAMELERERCEEEKWKWDKVVVAQSASHSWGVASLLQQTEPLLSIPESGPAHSPARGAIAEPSILPSEEPNDPKQPPLPEPGS